MKKQLPWLLVFAATLVLSPSAWAQDDPWANRIPSDAMRSYLPAQAGSIVVVSAGEPSWESNGLRRSLVRRINQMEGFSATSVREDTDSRAGDDAVLQQMDVQPGRVILILRTYDAESGRTISGTFYDRTGQTLSAFLVSPGEVLQARAGDPQRVEPAPSEGVTEEASDAVASIRAEHEPEPGAAASTVATAYELGAIRVTDFQRGTAQGYGPDNKLFLYRGIHYDEIPPGQFFRLVGRPDLERDFDRRKTTRTAGIVLSSTVSISEDNICHFGGPRRFRCAPVLSAIALVSCCAEDSKQLMD